MFFSALKRRLLYGTALLAAALVLSSSATAQVPLNLPVGWNLLGNAGTAQIDVAATFGDASKISTVWKWDKYYSKWAFYTPLMSNAALISYAQSKNYEVLATIDMNEGYWVNAAAPFALNTTAPNTSSLTAGGVLVGWNLVTLTGGKSYTQSFADLSTLLNANSKSITSIWAWDTATSKWKFYAPSLAVQGGTVLADYITSKGYLPFNLTATTTSSDEGVWVNVALSADSPSPTPPLVVYRTSYENKMAAGAVLGPQFQPPSTQTEWFSGIDAYADFLQDGTYSRFSASFNYDNTKPLSEAKFGKFHFFQKVNGTWIDITSKLLADTTGCLHPRKALVADLNGDGKPDVVMACHGYDASPFPGEQQRVLLSQPDGTYKNVLLPITAYAHGGSVADVKGNGYADIVYTDTSVRQQPFYLVNNKDGTFTEDAARIPQSVRQLTCFTNSKCGRGIYSLEMFDFNSDGKYDLWVGGVYDTTDSIGSLVPTIYYNNGDTQTQAVIPLTNKIVTLDIVFSSGKIYTMYETGGYTGVAIDKYDVSTKTATTIYTHTGSYANGGSWFPWIESYNGNIVASDAAFPVSITQ